jgi:hypothetical protein
LRIEKQEKHLQNKLFNFTKRLLKFLKKNGFPNAKIYCTSQRGEILGLDETRVPFGIRIADGRIFFQYPWDDDPPQGGVYPMVSIRSWKDLNLFKEQFPKYAKRFFEKENKII